MLCLPPIYRMKLKLKVYGERLLIDLGEVNASSLTLGALKASISAFIQISNVELSLNKKDIFSGDESHITDLGIVSGDLIYVITGEEPQNNQAPRQRPQLLASHDQGAAVALELNANQNNTNDDDEALATTSHDFTMDNAGAVGGQSSESTSRSMLEPLVVSESTADQVPALLQELYSSSDITCPNDALFVLLHVLMIESGFHLPGQNLLPPNWKRSGFYTCAYKYALTEGMTSDCSLMAVPLGSSMVIHGLSTTIGNFKTDHLQLKAEHFVRDITQESAAAAYRSLDRVTNNFKDTICLALLNHLATSAGFRETQGLLSLPCEVKTRLMCFLEAKDICNLAQTCKEWNSIYKDNAVWRRLYLQKFESPEDTSLSRNWYALFKERYRQYLDQREQYRRFISQDIDDFGFPFRPFAPPFSPPNPFPPFLNGDHDRDPQLGGNQQNGRQGSHSPPNVSETQDHSPIGKLKDHLKRSPLLSFKIL